MNNNYNGYFPYNNYNPYMNMRGIPNTMYRSAVAPVATRSGGLLARLFPSLAGSGAATGVAGAATKTSITFSGILNGASKTLGVINQAIPVVYQIKPIWNNAKTMFRMAKAMNSTDNTTSTMENINETNATKEATKINTSNSNQPTFFQ